MADIFRQMQKVTCHDGRPNGGTHNYGCPCCREFADPKKFKKYSRKKARVLLKRVSDDMIGTRT